MNLITLNDQRNIKLKELDEIAELIKSEKRKFNADEESNFNKISNDIEDLNKQIKDVQDADEKAVNDGLNKKNNERKMNTNFSLLKTIRDVAENRNFNDETLELIKAGKSTFKDAGISHRGQIILPVEDRAAILAGTATAGQEVVAEDKMPLLASLKAKTILGQAGATFYSNLVGDVSIPTYAGTSSSWKTEVDSAADGGGAFGEVTLSPKRLTTYVDISKQFLAQDGINAEQALMKDIVDSILVKVENTVFDETAGDTSRPAGLFYNADYSGTLSGATSYAKLIGMKAAVDSSNALDGSLAYVTNPTLAATFETTSTDTGSGIFCMKEGKVGGYPVLVSSNVLAGKVAFGNWADYVVGQWGGMDITVDPYSQAINGKVRVIVNTYWDFKSRRAVSFKLNQLS